MSDAEAEASEVRRSRREKKKSSAAEALERLRNVRKSGRGHKLEDVTANVRDVYVEVDEKEYTDLVKQRQATDFVVDDDGGGYIDDGMDIFDEDEEEYAEKKKKKEKKEKPKGALTKFLKSAPSKSKSADGNQISLDDDLLLSDVLNEIGTNDAAPPTPIINTNPFKKRPVSPDQSVPAKRNRLTTSPLKRTTKKVLHNHQIEVPSPPMDVPSLEDVAIPDDDDFDDDVMDTTEAKEIKREPPVVKEIKEEVKENLSNSFEEDEKWGETTIKEEEPSVESVAGSELFYRTDENGKTYVSMYWMDAYEDDKKHPGTVYLFGRVMSRKGHYDSCCVAFKNIKRQIFFLPNNDEDGCPYKMNEVYAEVKDILINKYRVAEMKCRPVKRRFVNDGTFEDNEKVEVLEVQYESKYPKLPHDLKGKTFSGVYNTTTTSMERLLVEGGLKGTGWIEFTNFVVKAKESFCKYEFFVDMADDLKGDSTEGMKHLRIDNKSLVAPPMTRLMALNIITALNDKKENEIVMISYLLNKTCSIVDPSVSRSMYSTQCYVTKPSSAALPFDFREFVKSKGMATKVREAANEKGLLTVFLGDIAKEDTDPDFIVGHDMAATITLLMARAEKHKIPIWSRFSRLKRTATLSSLGHSKAAQWEMTAGRIIVDSRTSAMELCRSRNYDLTELASTLLNLQRQEVMPHEVNAKFRDSRSLFSLMAWSWEECFLPLRLLVHMNALPLAITITNIVGGVLSRTLMGGRSERNEFLLLHAFHQAGIIAPDKYIPHFKKDGKKEKAKVPDEKHADEATAGEEEASGRTGKAQYSGGLVLEPIKGLYETLILLLDFNSLYPSIIQEYNICFTTIRHQKNGNEAVEVPSNVSSKGILPTQIEKLVVERRNTKNLMKNERSEQKRKQYDIRQMALKLTANSMYGCLGFAHSRFYAKPLAALVTAKGREILMETKELVEKEGFQVIYGDTDSIMVNTNDVNFESARQIAEKIKSIVNKRREKLELELDGLFLRMLLLKKKKYAALTVNAANPSERKKELKGLDIVRRDWSDIAKQIGNEVVEFILDPSLSREELVEQIEIALTQLKENIANNTIPTEKFQILKQLTRNPSQYADLKTQSHALVASRLNATGNFHLKQGDVVEYIICEDGTSNSAAQRAYHRSELNENIKIDAHYYLASQVHPVVSRLCAPIEEMDESRIAELLGLDPSGYRRKAIVEHEEEWTESFEHCEGVQFECPACKEKVEIRRQKDTMHMCFDCCPVCSADWASFHPYIINAFTKQMSSFVERFSMAPFVCDDVTCGYKTRFPPLVITSDGPQCSHCKSGILVCEFSDKLLYEQQAYFRQIFEESLKINPKLHSSQGHRALAKKLLETTEMFLKRNQYNIVDLSFIFSGMRRL